MGYTYSVKVYIIGSPQSGKTTLANIITQKVNAPVFHTDSFSYRFKKSPHSDINEFVMEAVRGSSWIVEGRHLFKEILAGADKIIWLDLPLGTVLFRKWKNYILGIDRSSPILPWTIDIMLNQYYGILNENRIEDFMYSHNKKYKKLLVPYAYKLDVIKTTEDLAKYVNNLTKI